MKKHAAIVLAAATLAGCAGEKVQLNTHFDPADAAWAAGKGSGSVSGQAFLRQNGGGIVTCAGNEVDLTPVTPYATERITAFYGDNTSGYRIPMFAPQLPKGEPGYLATYRHATCDAQGNFSFTELPAGPYYLTTEVFWTVGSNILPEGGFLMQRVSVQEGKTQKVVLTH